MKKIIAFVLLVALVAGGIYFFNKNASVPTESDSVDAVATTTDAVATTTEAVNEKETAIGTSAGGRAITAYHYGSGSREVLLVGGTHGGYSWNTALVAYNAMDYLEQNPRAIPENVRVTVIPVLNPDGLSKVVSAAGPFVKADVAASESLQIEGRFNGNNVDLNRNFDCDWQAKGTWQSKTVSGGSAAFSEPESQAIKSYVESRDIAATVVWYSSAGGVYASNCHDGVLPETAALVKVFSAASGYPAHEEFDFYEITGDLTNWLAKRGTPAISVLLTTHDDAEWAKNQKGLVALLASLAE